MNNNPWPRSDPKESQVRQSQTNRSRPVTRFALSRHLPLNWLGRSSSCGTSSAPPTERRGAADLLRPGRRQLTSNSNSETSPLSVEVDTVVSMRWTVCMLLVLGVTGAAIWAAWPPREPEPVIFASEEPNIGVGAHPLLPFDQPLSATLFLTSGTGRAGEANRFCFVSRLGDGRSSCLFEVSLTGASERIAPGSWYRLTASFTSAPNGVPAGELLAVSAPASVRIAGEAVDRQSRFIERSEELSNWAMAYDVSGYLRTEGAYFGICRMKRWRRHGRRV